MSNVNVHRGRAEQQASTPPPLERPHGTRERYTNDKCRCAPCRAANASYERSRRHAEHNGAALVPAEPARRRLEELLASGLSIRKAAAASRVARSTLQAVLAGEQQRITAEVEAKVMAVLPPTGRQHPADLAEDVFESHRRVALALGQIDPSWKARSACAPGRRHGVPPAAFHSSKHAEQTAALRVCAGCSVRPQCLEYGLASEEPIMRSGVWGGTTPAERRQLERGAA